MLQGTVAQEHLEVVRETWLLDGPMQAEEDDPKPPRTHSYNCIDAQMEDASIYAGGDDCKTRRNDYRRLALQLGLAGWSTPPPLYVR